jgi:hypothetical protein
MSHVAIIAALLVAGATLLWAIRALIISAWCIAIGYPAACVPTGAIL